MIIYRHMTRSTFTVGGGITIHDWPSIIAMSADDEEVQEEMDEEEGREGGLKIEKGQMERGRRGVQGDRRELLKSILVL